MEWISVEDRLPAIYDSVIIHRETGVVEQGCLAPDGKWNYPMGGYGPRATHWMPLPEPPK